MADDAPYDPAEPESDPDSAPATTLVGVPVAAEAEPRGSVAVMESPESGERRTDFPVWSFPGTVARSEAATPAAAPVDRRQVELPFAPASDLVSPRAVDRPQPLFGPVGRRQPAVLVAVLAVVTLGVYALIWHQRVNRELEEFDPKLHSRPTRSTMAVTVPWLIGLLVTIAGAALIVGARLSVSVPFATHVTATQADYLLAGLVAVPYLTLLIPFSLVAVVMTLERLRCVEEHVGTTTDRQVRAVGTAMLLALPVVGGLVLLGVIQRRANAIWDAVAPAGPLSH